MADQFEQLGAVYHDASDPFSQLGAVYHDQQQQSQQPQQDMPLYSRIGRDVGAGLTSGLGSIASLGQEVANLPHKKWPWFPQAPDYNFRGDYSSQFGIPEPSLLDNVIQGAAKMAPYTLGGELGLAEKIPSMVARSGIESGIYGGVEDPNHLRGLLTGTGAGVVGGAAGKLAGSALQAGLGLPNTIKNYVANKATVDTAPKMIDDLLISASDAEKKNIPKTMTNFVRDKYKDVSGMLKDFAKPLNEANVRFDVPDGKAAFPNYADAANELLANRENLKNIFGTSSDLGRVNKELDIADNFLNNKDKWGVDFQDVWGRMKNLGDMARTAQKAGDRNVARMLWNLKGGLGADLSKNLEEQGQKYLGDRLKAFNELYNTKKVPFWEDPAIAKAAEYGKVSPGDTLARALYKPGNEAVFNQLPGENKNVALAQLITKGKSANRLADNQASNWANLTEDVQNAIANHNPAAAEHFNNLADIFGKKTSFGIGGAAREAAKMLPGGHKIATTMPFLQGNMSGNLSQILGRTTPMVTTPFAVPFAAGLMGGNQ